MSRTRLYVAVAGALILAIPIVSFISALVVFPLAVYAFFALVANFAPLLIAGAAGLNQIGLRINLAKIVESWQYCGILWLGCAFGLSRWGDAGSSMGGQNIPYFKVLFAPWLMSFGIPVF